ncbi:hypothetical protein GCM10023169_08260 [Georgenia halophila]|uniref:Uridine kinase n=1 Tax=Georgenia halophila TaxID=620889 RepID=A0ABP8KXA5_9MICO
MTADHPDDGQGQLFELAPGSRKAVARVVLLTGPSGSGKTSMTRRLGLPVVSLDDFYLDGDHPDLPHRYGIVDWDDPASWDADAAVAALVELATTGEAQLPVYDIPTNARTGTTRLTLDGFPVFVAEGIFAAEIVGACREEDILGDALCLVRPRAQTFWYRLLRDLGESRKPPLTLVRRGLGHARREPALVASIVAKGCRAVDVDEAERAVRALLAGPGR